jgi:hypothetical protein
MTDYPGRHADAGLIDCMIERTIIPRDRVQAGLTGTTLASRERMAYDRDVLALVLVTAAPHRVCGPCLAERARLPVADAWLLVTSLAETARFNARIGLCCVCTEECVTFGAVDRGRRAA